MKSALADCARPTASFMDWTASTTRPRSPGVQRVSPSLDWVQEFRVVDGPDAAGGGLNLGAAVNTITKSGTNDLHGSVYEYVRNNALDASNLLSAPGFDTLRFNQFGATVGGPVRKDKAFFFLGYEGQRRAQSPIYSHFILKCIDTEGCLGPGTPSINEVKTRPRSFARKPGIDSQDKRLRQRLWKVHRMC